MSRSSWKILRFLVTCLLCGILNVLVASIFTSKIHSKSEKDDGKIQIYNLAAFPSETKVALHMPCEESNMFATKCMCHIRCTSPKCENAVKLCEKYKERLANVYSLRSFSLLLSILIFLVKDVDMYWWEEVKGIDLSLWKGFPRKRNSLGKRLLIQVIFLSWAIII